jgi:2'-5' RNA ligase
VAIEIENQEVLDSINEVQSKLKIKAKPISTKNIHFTLFFIGEVSDSLAKKIQEVLESIEFQSFEISIRGVGVFPNPNFPRIIWVGADDEGGKKLSELASIVEEKLSNMGFQNDKPFKPHVTIFRVKNKIGNISDELKKLETHSFGVQKISEIKFKKSVLTSGGPIYSDLQVVKAKQ